MAGGGPAKGRAKKALATISTEGEHIVSRGSANEAMIRKPYATLSVHIDRGGRMKFTLFAHILRNRM